MEVSMDMEKFILMATLIPLILATALAFSILALCVCYYKLHNLRKKSDHANYHEENSKSSVPTTGHPISPPTISQHVHGAASMSKEEQNVPHYYNPMESPHGSHLVSNPPSRLDVISSMSREAVNDSGYEDVLACSNNISRMQGYHNDSGLCTKGLATKLSFASLSSSDAYYLAGSESSAIPYVAGKSLKQGLHNDSGFCNKDLATKLSFASLSSSCSDAYYYAGRESSAVSHEHGISAGKSLRQGLHNDSGFCNKDLATKLSFTNLSSSCSDAYYYAGSESSAVSHEHGKSPNIVNFNTIHSAVNLPVCSPSGYGNHYLNQVYPHQPLHACYLTKLYPLQSYAAPWEDTIYYNTNSNDLTDMVVSP